MAGVLIWLLAGIKVGYSNDLYHLVLNSPTTALTFLLLPLLHYTTNKFETRIEKKIDEIRALLDARPVEPTGKADRKGTGKSRSANSRATKVGSRTRKKSS